MPACMKCKRREAKRGAIVCQECFDFVTKKRRMDTAPIPPVNPSSMAQHGQANGSGFVANE